MIELVAPSKEVTVYADRALIVGGGTVSLTAGESELRINDLPQFIHDSLRAAGQGLQGARILNVDITTAYYSRPPETDLTVLHNELEQLQQSKQLLEARQAALNYPPPWRPRLGEPAAEFPPWRARGTA